MAENASLAVGLVATPQQWRRDLQAHVTDHVQGVVLRVLHDPADAYDVDVVILDDTFDFLTRAQVLALSDQGIRVLGVFDDTGRNGRGRAPLDALGVEAMPIGDRPEALLMAAATLDPVALRRRRSNSGAVAASAIAEPRGNGSTAGRGSVVVVGGGSGSPGRTEVAVAVASILGDRGEATVLLDVDEHDPSIAPRLGFEVTPGVLDALAALGSDGELAGCLGRRAGFATGHVGFDVVCGLASSSDWSQTRELSGLVDALRSGWRRVVVDTGPLCGPDQIPPGGARNAATRTALRGADHVVAVCTATPMGVLRFLQWAASAVELLGHTPLAIVVNRSPAESFQRGELLDQLTANLPADAVAGIEFLPEDRAVTAAVWDGTPADRGAFRATVRSVVEAMLPEPTARSRGHRRGLALFGARR
jgi:MinD-like ATPase involved in chromosome partitioning or flagellar assembly